MRSALREYFPAAFEAYEDLAAPDTLELLAKAPDPTSAAKLTKAQVAAGVEAGPPPHDRREDREDPHRAARRAAGPAAGGHRRLRRRRPRRSQRSSAVLNAEIATMEEQVEAHFGRHPDVEVYLSQPGLGPTLAARVLGEFGDDPQRYADARSRKNYAGTSPVTRASGKKKVVLARYVRNQRLADAALRSRRSARSAPPLAPAPTTTLYAPAGASHGAALRQLGNRLVGVLHGCLKTHTPYDEATAWSHEVVDTEQKTAGGEREAVRDEAA